MGARVKYLLTFEAVGALVKISGAVGARINIFGAIGARIKISFLALGSEISVGARVKKLLT